jgi:hypothetical protein
VLVRRISTPASQMAAMRSYCSSLVLAWKCRRTRVHGGGQLKGGEYGVAKGGVLIVFAKVW